MNNELFIRFDPEAQAHALEHTPAQAEGETEADYLARVKSNRDRKFTELVMRYNMEILRERNSHMRRPSWHNAPLKL